MTDIIFSFDTEDFTSSVAADAICREADILREEGVKGGFCIVGLLADQLKKWGRDDVVKSLEYHDVGSHSYGHTLHPTINEYTDLEDFDEAYDEFMRQEQDGASMINTILPERRLLYACPPANQKSYVAMYGYYDMGIPVYADTFCDTEDGRGVFYCNIYQIKYTFGMEKLFEKNTDEDFKEILDFLATKKRAILYAHPNMAKFTEPWDLINYRKRNLCEFGEWKECPPRSEEETEQFYANIRKLVRLIKEDKRFNVTTYTDVVNMVEQEGERKITVSDISYLREKLSEEFFPVTEPVSLCISDMFLACKDFLMGKKEHICGKVYGFLDTPYAVEESVTLKAEDIVKSASLINTDRFLPTSVDVAGIKIGPADWMRAAMAVICGEETVTLQPATQLPSLDILPDLTDDCLKGWQQSDDYKDEYLCKRLKLQSWTMRFMK